MVGGSGDKVEEQGAVGGTQGVDQEGRFAALLKPPREFDMSVEDKASAFKKWIRQYRFFATSAGLDRQRGNIQVSTLMTTLGEAVFDLYDTFVIPENEVNSVEFLIAKFEDAFKSEVLDEIQEREIFRDIRQGARNFDEFLLELKIQVKRCNYGALEDSMIRDQIVQGIQDPSTKKVMYNKKNMQLQDAISICRAQERLKKHMERSGNPLEVESENVHTVARGKKDRTENPCEHCMNRKKFSQCENCGRAHNPKKCPAEGVKCYKCGLENHYARCCKKEDSKGAKDPPKVDQFARNDSDDEILEMSLYSVTVGKEDPDWSQDIRVGDKKLNFKLDTGAQVNIVSKRNAIEMGFAKVRKPKIKRVRSFNMAETEVLGEFVANCGIPGRSENFEVNFLVVGFDCVPILGASTCVQMNLIQRVKDPGEPEMFLVVEEKPVHQNFGDLAAKMKQVENVQKLKSNKKLDDFPKTSQWTGKMTKDYPPDNCKEVVTVPMSQEAEAKQKSDRSRGSLKIKPVRQSRVRKHAKTKEVSAAFVARKNQQQLEDVAVRKSTHLIEIAARKFVETSQQQNSRSRKKDTCQCQHQQTADWPK